MAYQVKERTTVRIADPMFGYARVSFPKGRVEPKSEDEERALSHLVSLGRAAPAPSRPAPKTTEVPSDEQTP